MHRLVIYVPFDYGYELDVRPLLKPSAAAAGAPSNLERLTASLGATSSEWVWTPGFVTSAHDLSAYGGEAYRAPCARPPFLCSGDLEKGTAHWRTFAACSEPYPFELDGVNATLQEYGIGVFELSYAVTRAAVGLRPAEFAKHLCDLCDDDALRALLLENGAAICRSVSSISERERHPFADDQTSLVHRDCSGRPPGDCDQKVELVWFHSLLILDNRDGTLGAVGGQEWREALNEAGLFPRTEDFFSDAFSFKCVRANLFSTRNVEAAVLFGWGNSAVVLKEGDTATHYDRLVPIRYVMRILQSFSAGLYMLNSDLVRQILENLHGGRGYGYREYRRRAQSIDNLRFRADIFLSLMEEQRYAQSAHEQVLWDAANAAWQTDALIGSLRDNLALLHKIYEKKRALLDDRVRSSVTNAVAVITIASASAVGFELIETVRQGPDWEKLAFQGGVLSILLVFAVALLFLPRGRS